MDAADALVAASCREATTASVARCIVAREGRWIAKERPGAFAATLEDGVVAGACVPMAADARGTCAVIELASWPSGTAAREQLARDAVEAAARAGARMTCVAMARAGDEATWRAAGLRRSSVRLEAWVATWGAAAPRDPGAIWHDAT